MKTVANQPARPLSEGNELLQITSTFTTNNMLYRSRSLTAAPRRHLKLSERYSHLSHMAEQRSISQIRIDFIFHRSGG